MDNYRMCRGKVRFEYDRAVVEAWLQASQYPHFTWNAYDCLWCDYAHIGRAGNAPGHGESCRRACARRAVQAREWRRFENIW